jgi:membrane protein CcdC involved in cytochrome C biogenesis
MSPIAFVYAHPVLLLCATFTGFAVVLTLRMKEATRALSLPKIVIPPLGMSTGFSMFLEPTARIPIAWALVAFALGALVFSIPLSRASKLTRVGSEIRVQRSNGFLWIVASLFLLRFVLRSWVEQTISPIQTGALFFVLAFGMIVTWRASMLRQFLRLSRPLLRRPRPIVSL